ncbi:pilus assembly protein TadG-related protein [Burkholderia cepacia]|uniref:pilus assembly protein TadG-related protein n=1 Tax=Burkholderia cepacia TaxID=292 RepID=UPI001FC80F03|nr:pilus assembly protein TadG-related protein [Burkholderia cepacia]
MHADQLPVARQRGACGLGVRRQRGSVALMATIWLMVALIVLGAIDIGRFYAERRRLQSAADLAALSAAPQAIADSTCSAALTAASQIANPSTNALPANSQLLVTCGVWSAPAAAGGVALFTPTAGAPATSNQCAGLSSGSANGQSANAVCVSISEPVSGLFRSDVRVNVSAIAKVQPADTFTLTTSVAALNGGLVNQLLQVLTGSPNVLSLQVADYQGLAQVNLKLAGILANLPVGTSTGVLNGTVTLGQLANAAVQAATQQNLLGANLNVLNAIVAGLCSGNVCGGPQIALGQLVSAATATGTSAVNASVNALGLLSTALQIANGQNSVNISSLNVATPAPLGPLVNASVQGSVTLGAIQPATASGPPGPANCGTFDCTTNTSTSQGTVSLTTSVALLSTCSDNSVIYGSSGCSGAPSFATVTLPVTVSVAPATAGLMSVVCTGSQKIAKVNVQTGVLAAYIGGAGSPNLKSLNSGYLPDSSPGATPTQLVSVNLQGLLNLLSGTQPNVIGPVIDTLTTLISTLTLGTINLNQIKITVSLKPGQLTVPIANQSPTTLTFTSSDASPYMQGPVSTAQFLAPAVQGIAKNGLIVSVSLIDNKGLLAQALQFLGIDLNSILNKLLSSVTSLLLPALANVLVPLLLQPIDSVLSSVAGLLGLGLGNAYVTNTPDSIKCGNPMLVQ